MIFIPHFYSTGSDTSILGSRRWETAGRPPWIPTHVRNKLLPGVFRVPEETVPWKEWPSAEQFRRGSFFALRQPRRPSSRISASVVPIESFRSTSTSAIASGLAIICGLNSCSRCRSWAS